MVILVMAKALNKQKNKYWETSKEKLSKLEYYIVLTDSARQKAEENRQLNRDLERQMLELEQRRKELDQREAQNDFEKKKLEEEKKKVYNNC